VKTQSGYRWFVVLTFFAFMLLHQCDRLLIGPLTSQIMATFNINEAQMGAVVTGALIVGAVMYPIWGYLYDRYARSKLLAAASFIWGSTTWISAIAPTYGAFVATRATTGIDDSSYPGLYSLIADYFEPRLRGRVYGLLQIAQPFGYMLGMLLGLFLGASLGWRGIYYLTGGLGILLAAVIWFGVREAPRGKSEPELAELSEIGQYHFDWKTALGLFKKRTLLVLFVQGFFGVFPWNVITYWFFRYLEVERHYSEAGVFTTMAAAVIVLSVGYFVGGAAGDWAFKRTPRGRALVSMVAVLAGAILLWVTMGVPMENTTVFMVMLCLTALFIPVASSNVICTVYDITLPEVRSTAMSVQYFIESAGAALAPLMAGLIAVRSSLGNAILLICISTWILCALFFAVVAYLVPTDIATLRGQLRERAEKEKAAQAGA